MHVPEEAVMGLLKRQSKRVRRSEYTPDPPARQQQSKPDTLRRPESGAEKAEFELLRLHLSQDESLLNWLTSTIGDEDIKAFHYVEIFQMFHGRLRKELPINHSRLLDEIESAEIRRFIARLINEARPDLESISHAHQCIKTVRWWAIQREMDELKQLMRDADARGEDSQEYFRRKVELQLEQRDIKPNPTPM
jgi:hypothetical protein